LVKATAGAAVSRTAKIILWICIIFIIGRARMIDIGSLGAIVLLQMNGEISFVWISWLLRCKIAIEASLMNGIEAPGFERKKNAMIQVKPEAKMWEKVRISIPLGLVSSTLIVDFRRSICNSIFQRISIIGKDDQDYRANLRVIPQLPLVAYTALILNSNNEVAWPLVRCPMSQSAKLWCCYSTIDLWDCYGD